MVKTVEHFNETGELPAAYDLCAGEFDTLLHMMTAPNGRFEFNGVYNAISTAFNYGFVLGARAQRNGAIKKRL